MSLVVCTALLVCTPVTSAEIDLAHALLRASGFSVEFKALALAVRTQASDPNVVVAKPTGLRDGFE